MAIIKITTKTEKITNKFGELLYYFTCFFILVFALK